MLAVESQRTFTAFGRTCGTDVPTEQNDAVAKITAFFGRQDLPQLPLYLFRILSFGKPQLSAYADAVSIADDAAGDAVQIAHQ